MSHAIIRNAKYKMSNMQSISRHNERQNFSYGNKDIDTSKSDQNYHLKEPQENSYEKEFYRLKEKNQLKGNLRLTGKKQSNIACEFLITSDDSFFNKIGQSETKRFFEEAYQFACNKCGEKNIISAVVHLDETTPHMHLTYIPVVEGKNKKGEPIEKVNCSAFWKGFNSYGALQDKFYEHMKEQGFELERGQKVETLEEKREHLSVQKYKEITLQERITKLEAEKSEAETLLNKIDNNINVLHVQETHSKKQLEDNLKALKEVADIKGSHAQINAIEGKIGTFHKDKVTINKTDFEYLKILAKKSCTQEYELNSIKNSLESKGQRIELQRKNINDLIQENRYLKKKNSDLKEKNEIMQELLEKKGISKELTNKTVTDIQEKLHQQLQKMKANKKDFNLNIER